MSPRSLVSVLALAALAAGAAACGSSPTGSLDATLRSSAASDVQVTVDSVVGSFDPHGITYAAFTVRNVSSRQVWVAGCIEGLAASIEQEVNGEWKFGGGTMCWGSEPRYGFPLATGGTVEGAIQVMTPGRYRVVVRFATDAERDVAHDVASSPFDAR